MKGVLDVEFIKEMITPLLTAKGLANDITLAGLYAFNQIELHFYTTDVNAEQLVKVDLSHTTHPDLTIVQALHMSMAFPLAFTPVPYRESLYIDGGLLNNFPLNDCLSTVPTENVLAFKNVWSKTALGNINVSKDSSLAEFLMTVVKKMAFQLDTTAQQKVVPYTVECHLDSLDGFEDWVNTMSSPLSREVLVKKGEEDAQLFLENHLKNKI
jgi:predicted acylesterase/phospholipase RssA